MNNEEQKRVYSKICVSILVQLKSKAARAFGFREDKDTDLS